MADTSSAFRAVSGPRRAQPNPVQSGAPVRFFPAFVQRRDAFPFEPIRIITAGSDRRQRA